MAARKLTAMDYASRLTEIAAHDPQLKAMLPDPDVTAASRGENLTYVATVDLVLTGYAERASLGERAYDVVKDPESGSYQRSYKKNFETISYGQLRTDARAIAMAWRKHPDLKIERDDLVCMLGFASIDYQKLDIATIYSHVVAVPLQSQTSGADLDGIFAKTNPTVLAATVGDIEIAARHAVLHGDIPTLVVFDYDERITAEKAARDAAQAVLDQAGCKTRLVSIEELIEAGKQFAWEDLPAHPDGDERMALILHSSGSTGTPKGAVFREKVAKRMWVPSEDRLPQVAIVFAPFNHGMGRSSCMRALNKGGTAYFTLKPDMSTLFDDIRIVRPTWISFFPRVFDLIYKSFQNEVASRTASAETDKSKIEQIVKEEMRYTFLGDRLRGGLVGSAPTTDEMKDFIADCFDLFLAEGYGNTESGTGLLVRDNVVARPPVVEYRLRDVPELGYYTTDKPYPRGEFCYKASHAVTEYYKDPEATAALFDEDGFSCTGDIVEERAPDHIYLIDRRKDVIKLAQAEYVAVGSLGATFENNSASIHQSYIYGNSLRSYLLAVVVPDQDVLKRVLGNDASETEIKAHLRDELQKVAKSNDLKSFEVPRDFILEYEPFSQENGLLSSVSKRLRPALNAKYAERLEAIYDEHERKQGEDLAALKDPDSPLTTLEKLGKILESVLGRRDFDLTSTHNFFELGGDSLGAMSFALTIEDTFGIEQPADALLSPTGSLQKWAEAIDTALKADTSSIPTARSVHGQDAEYVSEGDLTLDTFLGTDLLDRARGMPLEHRVAKTVLLTGGNGFLGHLVALQWMEKLAPLNGTLICVVRGKDDEDARARLESAFVGCDENLTKRFAELAKKHLEVVAGDASQIYLGLGEERFGEFAQRVDRISHVGALVNHRLAYEHLFGPNVVGTAEIIRLAITDRKKPIDFVSTQAVNSLLDPNNPDVENAELLPRIALVERYAMGYAASKWAGEHLLHRAHKELGLPVNILRGGMMLAHQSYAGQINTADTFSRLLASVVLTGQAPYSFYPLDGNGKKQTAHYEGLPGDVVAAAVIAASDVQHEELRAFSICNYNWDDNCSLDSFVDAIETAGYELNRIPDHAQWLNRFTNLLNNLPDEQKQMSALNILGAFRQPAGRDIDGRACANFKSLVPNFSTGDQIPHLDEAFIHKCLRDLQLLGMIPEPQKAEPEPVS